MVALVAGGAVARVAAHGVDALAVAAGRGGALVDVDLAARARRARHAHALEAGGRVQREGLAEDGGQRRGQAGRRGRVRCAVERALAALQAHATVLAGRGGALVHVRLAVLAGEAGVAGAVVVVHVVDAGASVAARPRRALVDVELAIGPAVTGAGAVARVPVQSVRAAPAVLARRRLRTTYVTIIASGK